MAKSYTDYLKEILLAQDAVKDQEIAASDSVYQAKKDQVKNDYTKKIQETDQSYLKKVSDENIRKLIEERKLNEAMGNLGLSDSGYGKAQKENAEILHEVNKDKIISENKAQSGELEKEMNQKIQAIEADRNEAASKIEADFLSDAQENAEELFKADQKATKSVSSKNKKDDEEEVKEPEIKEEKEEDEEEIVLSDYQKENVKRHLEKLPTRQEYLRERKINNTLPDYSTYIIRYLNSFLRNDYLTYKEYYYILKVLNVQKPN